MKEFIRRRKPDLKKRLDNDRITAKAHTLGYYNEVIQWLGVYLGTGLQFRVNKNLWLKKEWRVEARVYRL